jgi:hypothetical protein
MGNLTCNFYATPRSDALLPCGARFPAGQQDAKIRVPETASRAALRPFAGAAVPVPGRGNCPQGFVASGKLMREQIAARANLNRPASPAGSALDDAQQARPLRNQSVILVGQINVVGDHRSGARKQQARENQREISYGVHFGTFPLAAPAVHAARACVWRAASAGVKRGADRVVGITRKITRSADHVSVRARNIESISASTTTAHPIHACIAASGPLLLAPCFVAAQR